MLWTAAGRVFQTSGDWQTNDVVYLRVCALQLGRISWFGFCTERPMSIDAKGKRQWSSGEDKQVVVYERGSFSKHPLTPAVLFELKRNSRCQ